MSKRLKILFVPHCPRDSGGWQGSRPFHLCRQFSRLYDLHLFTWEQRLRPIAGESLGAYTTRCESDLTAHKMWLLPNAYRFVTREYPRTAHLIFNQLMFRRTLRRLLRDVRPDAIVYGGSHHFTGFPPLSASVPMVFDYVDKSPAWVESAYVAAADAVVTVSDDLAAAVAPSRKPTAVVPNGVDLTRYASMGRAAAKQKLGLTGATVISLIGLTCDPSLYFIDAVKQLRQRIANVKLLIVGGGDVQRSILQRCDAIGLTDVHAVGAVPHSEVHCHFAATDVGLYPGADTPYFRESSPLKIVEYSAAGAQVVTSPVKMFLHGWPNIRVAAPTAAAFADAMHEAIVSPQPAPDLQPFDWAHLAGRFDQVITGALDGARTAARDVNHYQPAPCT